MKSTIILMTIFVVLGSVFNFLTIKRYLKKRKNEGTFVFKSCENRTGVSTGDRIPVLEKGTKKKEVYYTGSRKLLGIGLLHKSNLVPVWDETDAKEITKMRR